MFANTSARILRSALVLSAMLTVNANYVRAQFEFPGTFGPIGSLSQSKDPVSVTAEFTAATSEKPAMLFVTAKIDPGFHLYAMDQGSLPNGGGGPLPMEILLDDGQNIELLGDWQPLTPPETHIDEDAWPGLEMREHLGKATWAVPVQLPGNIDPASLVIDGKVVGQVCNPQTCVPISQEFHANQGSGVELPESVSFATIPAAQPQPDVNVISGNRPGEPPQSTRTSSPAPRETAVAATTNAGGSTDDSLVYLLGLAFLGGLILNVMPCVLPVIGLKIFAFIEQAGQNRWKIFALNLWYALGVISVFMILAILSIVFQLGWGQLFQYPEFNIAMAAIVFAMGLSFLGVWEIPIPGFIGTSKVTDIGRKEGYEGAFAKGTITTLLATPCTGPFMGTALVGVLSRPPHQILAIFFSIGLGMASPYLLIGAFPQLIRFLPKPGEWMNTFKQLMGFVLIGTVVYLLTLLKSYYVVPTVAFLFGIWLACWWIGRVPITAESSRRWNALGEGILAGSLVGLVAFYWLAPILAYRHQRDANRLAEVKFEQLLARGTGEYFVRNEPWQVYSERKLQWLLDHGKTVLIDFTADWCLTCKLMEKTVLKTDEMAQFFEENEIYTLVADWTQKDDSSEVTEKLNQLGAKQIPLLAIYSPTNRDQPILIPGTYTTAGLTAELLKADSVAQLDTEEGMAEADAAFGPQGVQPSGLR